MKRLHWFEAALILAVMAIHAYAAISDAHNFSRRWFTRDDAYFYFKTAQNIGEGLGSTFDGINPTNGYHPLWMLVCIPIFLLARFDLILPLRLLTLIMGGLSALSGVLLFRLLRNTLYEPWAMLATAYWAFNTYIHETITQLGLETGLVVFTVLLLLRRVQAFEAAGGKDANKQVLLLSILATTVFLSRLDMIFLAGLIGVWVILRGSPLRYFVFTDSLIIAGGALVSFAMWLGFPQYYAYSRAALLTAAGLLVVRLPLLHIFGLNDKNKAGAPLFVLTRTALVTSIGSASIGVILLLLGDRINGFPRMAILVEAGLSFVLLCLVRMSASWTWQRQDTPSKPMDWKRIAREGTIFYSVLGGTLIIYMLFNLFYFGTATPVSGQVKRWWGAPVNQVRGGPASTLEAFIGIDRNGDFNAWPQVTPLVANLAKWLSRNSPFRLLVPQIYLPLWIGLAILIVIVLLLRRRRALRGLQRLGLLPLFAGCGFQVLAYNATGYSAVKEWYWAGQMLFTVLFAAMLANLLIPRRLRHAPANKILRAGATVISMGWCAILARDVLLTMPLQGTDANRPYVDSLEVLESHTEPGSIIGVTGGGSLGYFIRDRHIVNMDGLINSAAYFDAMRVGKAADYLYEQGVDYIFANPTLLTQLAPFKTQFKGRLVRLGISYGQKELMKIRPSTR